MSTHMYDFISSSKKKVGNQTKLALDGFNVYRGILRVEGFYVTRFQKGNIF